MEVAANFAAVTSLFLAPALCLKSVKVSLVLIYQLPCLNLAAPIGARIAGSYLDLAGRFIVGPDIERAIGGFTGNPVDMTTGRKLLANETDSVLPRAMPIEWSRFYASDLTDISAPGGVRVHLHYEPHSVD
ncbi:DUF6531 domain-containing protein [Pseudomonas sp. WHRI 8519]|uniref:DUF6531 domain-containing protein n=1 Tax=Pseudomonas sp. WHRI 8519 TaxID=3162567 RepID=UPI0032EC36D8